MKDKFLRNAYNNFSLRTKIALKKSFTNLELCHRIAIMQEVKKADYF